MGIEIDRTSFGAADRAAFTARVEEQLQQLRNLLASPAFGRGPATMGAELELYIIDAEGRPGTNAVRLKAYGRAGQPCMGCGRAMASGQVAQRTTVWCPTCQPG